MKKNENKIKEYIKIAEQISVPIFFVDQSGVILSINNSMLDLVNKGLAEESVGTNILKYKSYQGNGLLNYVKRALSGEKISTELLPFKLYTHDKTVNRKFDFVPLSDDDLILGLMIVVVDIDIESIISPKIVNDFFDLSAKEDQEAKERLLKSNDFLNFELIKTERDQVLNELNSLRKRFDIILDSAPCAIIELEERKIVYASAGTKKVFGWDPQEVIGKSTRIFYRSYGDFIQIAKIVYTKLAERPRYEIKFPCRTKKGKEIECLVSLTRTSGFQKKQNVVVVYEDISSSNKISEQMK